jgi:type II secretory pathway component PulM
MLTIKKLGKREKILAIAVGALLLAFVFKLLIFNPLLDKTSSAKFEIEQARLGIRKY